MRNRSLVRGFALLATVTLAPLHASAQGRGATPARTPDGKPDLAGIYSFSTVTPLQRPDALEGKATLNDEEAAAFEAAENTRLNRDLFDPAGVFGGEIEDFHGSILPQKTKPSHPPQRIRGLRCQENSGVGNQRALALRPRAPFIRQRPLLHRLLSRAPTLYGADVATVRQPRAGARRFVCDESERILELTGLQRPA